MIQKDILVLGATGNQGGTVASMLNRIGFRTRGLARHPDDDQALRLKEEGVTIVEGDLTDAASLKDAMDGAYGVYMVLPFFQEDHQREVEMGRTVIEAAQAAGIEHVVYSSGSRANERTGVPHLDTKGDIERLLRETKLNWTVLRPVAFNYSLDAYKGMVANGFLADARPAHSVIYQVDEHDHARHAALALLQPQDWIGRGLDTASDALTLQELAGLFGKVSGKPVEYRRIGWDEEEDNAGAEVVRLAKWVDSDGPRIDMDRRRRRFPWLTPLEAYLREHGWEDLSNDDAS